MLFAFLFRSLELFKKAQEVIDEVSELVQDERLEEVRRRIKDFIGIDEPEAAEKPIEPENVESNNDNEENQTVEEITPEQEQVREQVAADLDELAQICSSEDNKAV